MEPDATLSTILRDLLDDVPSIRAVAREAGLHHASLLRFYRGDTSLRLDKADKLARYFGITHTRKDG